MHQKLAPDPFSILLNNLKQPLHAINSFKNKVFWKRIIKNPYKVNFIFFFRTQSLSMDKVIKNKRGLEVRSFFRSRNKFRKIPLLVMYYLTKFDDVM